MTSTDAAAVRTTETLPPPYCAVLACWVPASVEHWRAAVCVVCTDSEAPIINALNERSMGQTDY